LLEQQQLLLEQQQIEKSPQIQYSYDFLLEENEDDFERAKSQVLDMAFDAMLLYKQENPSATYSDLLDQALPVSMPIESRSHILKIRLSNSGGMAATDVEVEIQTDAIIDYYTLYTSGETAQQFFTPFPTITPIPTREINPDEFRERVAPKQLIININRMVAKENIEIQVFFANQIQSDNYDRLVVAGPNFYPPNRPKAKASSHVYFYPNDLGEAWISSTNDFLTLWHVISSQPSAAIVVRYNEGEPVIIPSPTPQAIGAIGVFIPSSPTFSP
jgi:hypothetical protein